MPRAMRGWKASLTLAVFLVFRVPGIWQRLNLSGSDEGTAGLSAGVAMIICAITVLTVDSWAGPSHSVGGASYADAWRTVLAAGGWTMLLAGSGLLVRTMVPPIRALAAQAAERTGQNSRGTV